MSEPTYSVKWCAPGGGLEVWDIDGPFDARLSVSVAVDDNTLAPQANALAERIASLLTQDDERIAREGHRERCTAAGLTPSEGDVADAKWIAWSLQAHLTPQRASLAELDRLEAAYRATQEPAS